MSSIKTKKIESALLRKGFQQKGSRHKKFTLYDSSGRRMPIVTVLSHGSLEYNDGLLNLMAKQLRLKKGDFHNLVNCFLTLDDYYNILRSQGFDC